MRIPRASILSVALLGLTAAHDRAQAQKSNPPYSLEDVIVLVQGGHSNERIVARVGPDCIAFRVNAAAEAELQKAGADTALAAALRDVCYRAIATPTAGQPRQPQGVLVIVGELPPGWSRVVNELPATMNRTITLTAGRPAVVVVSAPGWCADTLELTLQGDERRDWTPALRGKPWVGDC